VQQNRTPKRKCVIEHGRRGHVLESNGLTPLSQVHKEPCETKVAPTNQSPERLKKLPSSDSTNPDAQEAPVIVQTNLAASKKICDGCDRLPVAARAGTDCQDEVTQRQARKFSWL
jgi:hypothetical protein